MGTQKSVFRQWLSNEGAAEPGAGKATGGKGISGKEPAGSAEADHAPTEFAPSPASEPEVAESRSRPSTRPSLLKQAMTPMPRAQRNNMLVISLLGLDILLGLIFGAAGYLALESEGIALAGASMAAIGLATLIAFLAFGREK